MPSLWREISGHTRASTAARGHISPERIRPCPARSRNPSSRSAVNVEGTLNVPLAWRDHGVRLGGGRPGELRLSRCARRAVSRSRSLGLGRTLCCSWMPRSTRSSPTTCSPSRRLRSGTLRLREHRDPVSGHAVVNPKFIRMMLAGQRPTIYGEGETSRDFIHVENVIHATIAAAE
jgi:hypothetical protein